MRAIDADRLIDDLKHDVAMDQDSLDYEELTDSNREKIQFDKDCKQNAIDLLRNAPTIEPESYEDAVSRADVEAEIANILKNVFVEYQDIAKKAVAKLPSVTPKLPECEDAVSRQAVIDAARKVHDIFEGEYDTRTPYGVILDVQDAVIELPSVTPKRKWIPCSERLPEVGTYVLISKKALNFRSNLPSVCTAHRSCDPRSGKEEWNDMLFGELDDDDVLAWMPLPEPYSEKMSGGEKE